MASNKIRAAAIRALEDEHGRVTAAELVQAARHKKHPLHKEFEWDDTKAGYKYRLDQARQIIASVRVVVTHKEHRMASPAYLRDPRAVPNQGYVSVGRLQTEREAAAKALHAEIARVQVALERAREIAVALDLETEVEEVIGMVNVFVGRMRRGSATDGDEPRPSM